jgi:hypothetical protein
MSKSGFGSSGKVNALREVLHAPPPKTYAVVD